jgi:hypothetical protein
LLKFYTNEISKQEKYQIRCIQLYYKHTNSTIYAPILFLFGEIHVNFFLFAWFVLKNVFLALLRMIRTWRTYHVVGDDGESQRKDEKENNWERNREMRETKEEILIFGRSNENLETKTESKRIWRKETKVEIIMCMS